MVFTIWGRILANITMSAVYNLFTRKAMPGITAFKLKKQWKIIIILGNNLIYPNDTT